MPYFLENITSTKHKYQICDATSLIQYIGITCGSTNDSCTLHIEAKCILNSFLFLSKNDIAQALGAHLEILENLNKKFVILQFNLSKVTLNIFDPDAFGAIITISASNLLRRFMKSVNDDKILLCIIRCILTNLNSLIASQMCLQPLNALLVLVKNCRDLSNYQDRILNQMYLYLKDAHCRQALKVSDDVLGVVIKRMSGNDKIRYFEKINKSLWWGRGECVIVMHLLNYWPINVDVNVYLLKMAPRLAAMLLENITDYTMKVLKVAISHMDFETWNTVFIPNVVDMVFAHFDDNWDLITKTLAQCVNLGVQSFEAQVYKEMNPDLLVTCYPALALHYSVNKGCLATVNYQREINALIHSSDYVNQSYAVKTICVFNNKKSPLTSWHIEHIKFYLENTMFLLEDVCFKELYYFLSHMTVRANRTLQTSDLENLAHYTEFVQWLYEFIILGLLSRSLRGVKIGYELFNLVFSVICTSSDNLKTKYNLDDIDRYDQKQSAFYKHLTEENAWNCGSIYEIIAEEFLLSDKVFPEICSILEKWAGVSTKITPETAFRMLESNYGKEFVTKAECCLLLSLSCADTNNKVTELLEKWKIAVENFSNSSSVDAEVILTIYSLTSFISAVLQKRLLKSSESSFVLSNCVCIVRKLVQINLGHPRVVKSIEQIFVTIMNILCIILKISDQKQFSECFELANRVMEQGTGKSVACAAASAIHALCTHASESSSNAQEILNHYLESILVSIYSTPEVKLSKIRRNPEHRLIINAIVTADAHQNHVLLSRSMRFLLDVLENPDSGNSAKASSLHTLEILLSNSSIQNETFDYVSPAAIRAINEFSNADWNVKNGAIQVLQALINRLLGQKNNLTQRRRYGIDDLLVLYPDLMMHCHKQMYSSITEFNCNSVIAILAIFSETYYTSCNVYNDQSIFSIVESFRNSFISLIRTNPNVGVFAAKAYAALYSLTNIPTALNEIAVWIKQNFECITKNIFATVLSLLVAFLDKFNAFFMSKESVNRVNSTLLDLKLFLKRYNCKYEFSLFNVLSVVTYNVLELKDKICVALRRAETYHTRIWLNTNLPYVLNNISIEEFPSFLHRCLSCQLSITLLKHCIESVVNRCSELVKYTLINSVLTVLINKFINLEIINYVLSSLSETILLLLEESHCYTCPVDTVLQLRQKHVKILNIYSLSIYLASLSYCTGYVEDDKLFLQSAVTLYTRQVITRDSELQIYTASTLIFLYNCIDVSLRHDVLKASFILLLTPESSHEISKFIAFIFKQNLGNTYETLLSLLSVQNLIKCLPSKEEVVKFLNKLRQFVNTLDDEFKDCGMFYMKQNDYICSYKKSLLNVLEKQIAKMS